MFITLKSKLKINLMIFNFKKVIRLTLVCLFLTQPNLTFAGGFFTTVGFNSQVSLTLLAGNVRGAGNLDGTAGNAWFTTPNASVVDSNGNVFVADTSMHTIRKITPAGVVSTLAGSPGNFGFLNGPGNQALFYSPVGIAVDSADFIYVSDQGNSIIRKISQTGNVSTFAGLHSIHGHQDGSNVSAKFNLPWSTAVDTSGNVYVADYANNVIRKITSAGVSSVLAGSFIAADGTGLLARFNQPNGTAVDSSGNIYVADMQNSVIRKVSSAGVVTTLAGTVGTCGAIDDIGVAASFCSPAALAIDSSGNLYVSDTLNQLIRKVTAAGVVTTLAGRLNYPGAVDGQGTAASFSSPNGIATDSSGNVFVADSGNNVIRKISPTGVVSTIAGTALNSGYFDGTGPAASFNYPYGITVDSNGNVYVADTGNHLIRKISPTGIVTTLAGTVLTCGANDGTGTAAKFCNPQGLAVDTNGDLFVGDTTNGTIRKISSAGAVTTLAGTATIIGSADGTGSAASFNFPMGISVDTTGNLYVADSFNNSIRKVTSLGGVTTLAGVSPGANGTGPAASFSYPSGVAVDTSGNVYVADSYNHTIRKITSAGVVTTIAGTAGISGSANGTGAAASFFQPTGIAVDSSGSLYVSDANNSIIRKITSAGVVTTLAGTAGISGSTNGTGAAASFSNLAGIAVNSTGTLVYVVDSGNNLIRKITSAGVVTTFAGTVGVSGTNNGNGTAASFMDPEGITVDSGGNVYVSDGIGNQIRKITSSGTVTTLAGSGATGANDGSGLTATFQIPTGLSVDSIGNLYVADTYNHIIRKVTSAGAVTTFAGTTGIPGYAEGTGPAATFFAPAGLTVDSANNVYVADQGDNIIRKITSSGVVSTYAGTAGVIGSVNNTGSAASFNTPNGIAVDSAGIVYVADQGNNIIRKITTSKVVTTFAGTAGANGFANGTGPSATFSAPTGIAVDTVGNIYVADSNNSCIRKITSTGVVTTLAGAPGVLGYVDGTGAAANFYFPSGVAIDSSGNLFISDLYNFSIRKITSVGVVSTIAGSPQISGPSNGSGAAASFNQPAAVAADGAGNIYIADRWNHSVRKITSSGVVTTLAGSTNSGTTNGTGSAASFNFPSGIASDSAGNVYVADTSNHVIRKITPAGVVTTFAGTMGVPGSANGSDLSSSFNTPIGLAIDLAGTLFVADQGNNVIRKITSGGVVSTLAGSAGAIGSTDATGAAARFSFPTGVAVDSTGNVYVTDQSNYKIRKVTPAGIVTTLAGSTVVGSNDGIGSAASFYSPAGITVDSQGNLYVTDLQLSIIRKISPTGNVTTLAGTRGRIGVAYDRLTSGNISLVPSTGIAFTPTKLIIIQNNGIVRLPLLK